MEDTENERIHSTFMKYLMLCIKRNEDNKEQFTVKNSTISVF